LTSLWKTTFPLITVTQSNIATGKKIKFLIFYLSVGRACKQDYKCLVKERMNSSDTKKQILDIGENLLLDRGFNGFSYKDISDILGIKNASIHYHYARKSDLGTAIIVRAERQFERWVERLEIKKMTYPQRLGEFCSLYRRFLDRGGQVCLGGTLETDFKTLPAEMQAATRTLVASMLQWLEGQLREGRNAGEFAFPGKPRHQAVVVMTCLQGILQMVRATYSSYFDEAVDQIMLMLQA